MLWDASKPKIYSFAHLLDVFSVHQDENAHSQKHNTPRT
jgi:hypothetical protein